MKRKCAEAQCRTLVESPKRKCAKHLKASRQRTSRNAHVQRTYDLTPEEYQALEDLADGHCMGCGETRTYRLNVDHDHRVERELGTRASIRALLCRQCNMTLRKAGDNVRRLVGLSLLLQRWPSAEVFDFVQGYTPERQR